MKIRKIKFQDPSPEIKENVKIWAGSIFYTCLFNAISSPLPTAERFFIASLNHFRMGVQDPELKKQIAIFIGQEKWHMDGHNELNSFLNSQDLLDQRLKDTVEDNYAKAAQLKPEDQLALTVALEHFTAILSRYLLKHEVLIEKLNPHFRSIWIQHAIEELEHKNVAFDLMKHAHIGYWTRIRAMARATVNVYKDFFVGTYILCRKSKAGWVLIPEALHLLFNFQFGLVWHLIPEYLRYFLPNFHPSDVEDKHYVERFLNEYKFDQAA